MTPPSGAAAVARAPRSTRSKRHVRRPPDLTSLFDVLFIVVFVALIRAAAAQHEVARLTAPPPPPPKPAPPGPPPGVAALRTKALANLERDLAERMPLVVRISTQLQDNRVQGTLAALEHEGRTIPLDVPLLADNREQEAAYLGESSAEMRLCRIATVHLSLPDLARHLVIVVPDRPYADLKRVDDSRALFRGLQRDVERCFTEQRGIAALIDPAGLPAPPAEQPTHPTEPPASSPAAPSPP